MRIIFKFFDEPFLIGKVRVCMKKFSEAEIKKIAEGVKQTTKRYGLPTQKKKSNNDKK